MTQQCELCLKWSGIYDKANRCCMVRAVALSPKAARLARYQVERAERGPDAERQLRDEVTAEYQRWQAHRATKETT
ncbi:hypothetical protein [Cupriavidus pauculus]|uniref:hypothetical protein n=1 Tax=Cupriavidus pauculus TaxID=82633 RepID=UPI001D0C30CE|nr:hypothetical protein [Cupriavidus pauculus]